MAVTAANLSKYLAEQIGKWAFTDDTVTRPTAWYAALMSVKTTKDAAGTEFSAVDYARIAVVMNETGALSLIFDNDGALEFGTPATNWGTALGVSLYDALTGGNLLAFYDITAPGVACDAGAPVSIPAAALIQNIA